VLTDALSWRWIFFLNVPVSAFAVLVTYRFVKLAEPDPGEQRIDYAGISALSVGLVSLLVALDQVDDWGFGDPRVIGMLALSAVLLVTFVPIERRAGSSALVPRAVMANESFRASCAAILFMSATFFAALLYLPQFMQKHLGYSPLEAGVGMLPFLAVFAAVSFVAGPLYERLGAKLLASVGAACITIAPFVFSMVGEGSGYGSLVAGMVVLGIGIGSFYPTATTAGVTSVDESETSLAGGIVYMFQIAGGAIGLGITTTIFTLSSENELADKASDHAIHLTNDQVAVMHGVLAGTDAGTSALHQLSASAQNTVMTIVRESFATGIQAGFRFVTIAALLGFLISLFFVGGRLLGRRVPEPDRARA